MWLLELLSFLAKTIGELAAAKARNASNEELRAIATESAVAYAALVAQQELSLAKAEGMVPGFSRD